MSDYKEFETKMNDRMNAKFEEFKIEIDERYLLYRACNQR